ncbi:MAG: DUF1127 domain-containing protein [Pseudorhodobacter sp.]|nr:DUF1127 domain-containing protein [Pseudorhodobacter sp.]
MTYEAFRTLSSRSALPPVAAVLFAATVLVLKWEERRKTRRALQRLDAHMLRDIGLTGRNAADEIEKPFWRE